MSEPPSPNDPSPLPWKDALPPLVLCAVLLGTGLVAGFLQEEPDTDEPVYLAMAESWAREGRTPYRDFFFAHPPGLLAPAAALFTVAEPSIRLARLVPVASTAALFLLVVACARRVEKRAALPGAALFAASLFVLSPAVHLVGASYLGMNLSAALVLAAALLLALRRPFPAGLAAGLSLLVRFSTLPAALVLAAASWAREAAGSGEGAGAESPEPGSQVSSRDPRAADPASGAPGRAASADPGRRRGWPFLAGLALGISPLALFAFVPGFFDQVFWFHLGKETMPVSARAAVLLQMVYEEKFLVLAAATLAFLPPGRRGPWVFLWAGLLSALFMAAQKVVWPYYVHVAVPFLCVAGAAGLANLLRGRLRGPALLIPNLALLLGAGALNVFLVLPRYRPDTTLLPLVEKAEALAGPGGRVLDLSGGGKACTLAVRTGLTVAGGQFDMSLHRVRHGSLSPEALVAEIRREPELVLTEWEAGGRTILWSRMPAVRRALAAPGDSGGYRPADWLARGSRPTLVILWVPALRGDPEPPPDFSESGEEEIEARYAVTLDRRAAPSGTVKGAFGMGDHGLLDALPGVPGTPGLVVARGAFAAPAPGEARWLAEDTREGRPVVSRVWAQPGGRRLLIETLYADAPFEPLSFADARFDPRSGRVLSLTLLADDGLEGFLRVRVQVDTGFGPS